MSKAKSIINLFASLFIAIVVYFIVSGLLAVPPAIGAVIALGALYGVHQYIEKHHGDNAYDLGFETAPYETVEPSPEQTIAPAPQPIHVTVNVPSATVSTSPTPNTIEVAPNITALVDSSSIPAVPATDPTPAQ